MLDSEWFLPPRPRRGGARLVMGAAAAGLLLAVGGCLNDSLSPSGGNVAQLSLRRVVAQVNAGEQATVKIDVGYFSSTEDLIPLPVSPSSIQIQAGATISQPIVVTLDDCLADPEAAQDGSGGCYIQVGFTLLDQSGAEISRRTVFPDSSVTAGQTVELADVVLSNVESVEVAPVDTLGLADTVFAVATAKTISGAVVTDATFQWLSYDTTIVTVDAQTGMLAAVSPGTAYVEASSDGAYGGTLVTVMDLGSFDVGRPGEICVTINRRLVCPGASADPNRAAPLRAER